MNSEWQATTTAGLIADGVLHIGDGYRAKNSELGDEGLPFARAANVNGKIDVDGAELLCPPSVAKAGDKVSRTGDTVFTSKGTVGRFAFVSPQQRSFVYSPQLCFWRSLDGSKLEPRFLFYWLQGPEAWSQFSHLKGQTDMADYVSLGDQRRMHLTVPQVREQRRIAGVLTALDGKIEHNVRLSRALMDVAFAALDQALALARTATTVGEIAEFFNRKRIPLSAIQRSERRGPYPYYGATGVFDCVDDYIFDGSFVLVGEDGSVITDEGRPVVQYVWGKIWVNNHAHVLQGRGLSSELLSLLLERSDVRAHVTGAVQPKLSMGNLKAVEIAVPTEDALASLEGLVAELFGRNRAAVNESRRLAAIRDTLLPRLVSGEVRVPDSYDPDDVLGTAAEAAGVAAL